MITKMFEGNGEGKKGCWTCLLNPILLATSMPK
jgi:hypothetical protein